MSAAVVAHEVHGSTLHDTEEVEFIEVTQLQMLGINAADISKLQQAGFHTVGQIMQSPSKVLLQIKGISDSKYQRIMEAAKKLKNTGFVSGKTALASAKRTRMHISTGCTDFDQILGGGIETGTVTELFGEFKCGKTQLCAMLAVQVQLERENGGANGKAIIIDTDKGFRLERVAEIAVKRYGVDADAVLENIIYAEALTHEHQGEILEQVAAKIVESEEPYRLLIVDSVISTFRTEFTGRGELSERQQKLAVQMRKLVDLAKEFNIAVVITNQVTADPGNMFVPDAKKPVGGNILAHMADIRIQLRKGKGNQRVAKIYAGPLPELEATFALTEKGIENAE